MGQVVLEMGEMGRVAMGRAETGTVEMETVLGEMVMGWEDWVMVVMGREVRVMAA